MLISYETPDEHLSYSELKDRIREECAKALPKKERILLMAQKLEEDLMLKDTICDQICTDLKDVTVETWIRRCLPDEYKQHRRKSVTKESTDKLRHSAVNDGKNVPEQTAMTVDNQGYEQPFDQIKRSDDKPASEIVKSLQKKVVDITSERDDLSKTVDDLSKTVEVLKEKTQPEMFREIQERFYDEPGLIRGDKLRKVHEEAGKNLVFLLERYNSVLQDAVERGQPVPVGLYIIARPEMVFVPVRFTVDFNNKKLNISLWEKKLQSPNQ
jgi:polyhydroxyalkanoate synthesis regulator phasin